MENNVVYVSKNNNREWILADGYLKTRIAGDIWRPAGWPQPDMRISDIAYYIEKGEMFPKEE